MKDKTILEEAKESVAKTLREVKIARVAVSLREKERLLLMVAQIDSYIMEMESASTMAQLDIITDRSRREQGNSGPF